MAAKPKPADPTATDAPRSNESPVERFRRLRETEQGWEPEMWAKMAEQGWLAIAVPEGASTLRS